MHAFIPTILNLLNIMYNLRRRTNLLLSLLLTTPFISLIFFSQNHFTNSPKSTKEFTIHIHKHNQLLAQSTCQNTLHKDLCISTLTSFPNLASKTLPQIISSAVNLTMHDVIASLNLTKNTKLASVHLNQPLFDCLELFDETLTQLDVAMSELITSKKSHAAKKYDHVRTLISAAMTNQYTCLEGFDDDSNPSRSNTLKDVKGEMERRVKMICKHLSNVLAMMKKMPGGVEKREDEASSGGEMKSGFPTWVGSEVRKFFNIPANKTKCNLAVAKDGSGNFTTITKAVAAAPTGSLLRFVIYIKEGEYVENVECEKNKTNLMFLGDGIGKGSKNVVDGSTTFRSATVAVVGQGFIAKGITFENTAGPSKHQAVAFRSSSDLYAFLSYQDTLYAHSSRECLITGTVDFIFGNAAVLFQNCLLLARKPNPNQKNIFTAQARQDPNQNTGISILNCHVTATPVLVPAKKTVNTYLGRAWKMYSRTVVMRSKIDDTVDPAGWLEWNATFALETLYYGEFWNLGNGSGTGKRVYWPGYRVIWNPIEEYQFTVGCLFKGTGGLFSRVYLISVGSYFNNRVNYDPSSSCTRMMTIYWMKISLCNYIIWTLMNKYEK